MIKKDDHKTQEGIKEILKIKHNMNTGREIFDELSEKVLDTD